MNRTHRNILALVVVPLVLSLLVTLLLTMPALAQPQAAPAAPLDPSVLRWAYTMAAASTAVSSVAAAFAVTKVASAAVAALTEKPDLFGRMVVLVGLAEGIAIYGLIVSILLLNQLAR